MGKLMDDLQRQLKNPEYKQAAEDCIEIYNWLKDTDPNGRIWESNWTPLVSVKFLGVYPNNTRIHAPNAMGYMLLKGIRSSS